MTAPTDYDVRLAARALRRYWWVVVGVPVLAFAVQLVQIRTAPYRAEFRAVVVLPGDTDDPGRSERPELMIMDDVPQLVDSALFAERVRSQLQTDDVTVGTDDVASALSASRYARTVTVVARDNEPTRAEDLALAAEAVFPGAVNEVLVVRGGPQAMITVIDPVDGARRGEPDQWPVALIVTGAMLFVGVLGALVLDGLGRSDPNST